MPSGIKNSQISDIKENEWDYSLDSPSRLHGSHTSIIPMSSNTQSARLFYGARFVNQAMPIENRETPLVQSLDPEDPEGRSFEQQYGRRMGAMFADDDAEVSKVTPDGIELKLADGSKKTVDLYNNFQFNRKTYLHNTPRVKPGDKVKKGQVLASSNFTDDDGTIAMGLNARTALVAYKGFSMDDAIVVSESFAKKMASMHNYQHEQAKDEELKYGKDHFSSVFPRKFTKEQMELMDDNGMVKPGTILHKGDPIMLATRPKPVYSNSEHLGKLGKVFRTIRGDASQVWDHDYPGMVTDVVDGKKNRKVFITAKAPLEVGDKLIANRCGQKCYHPDTEILTKDGWKKVGDITIEDEVASLFNKGGNDETQDLYAKFVHPLHTTSHLYDGELFCFESTRVAYAVTPNHRVWCRCNGGKKFLASTAERIHGKMRRFMDTAPFDLTGRTMPEYTEIPFIPLDTAGRPSENAVNRHVFKTETFVKFMAIYLCEGNISPGVNYSIKIAQKERPFCRELEAVLDDMGLHWKKYNNQYHLASNKSLAVYLRQFGHAADKYIPEWIFQLPEEQLRTFIEWAWQGDGDKYKMHSFYSSSPKFIEGIERILLMLGQRVSWNRRDKRSHQNYDSYQLTWHKTAMCPISKITNPFPGRDREPGFHKKEYHGPVYCVQVPGEGVVLTRLHGKTMWNGNSIVSKIIPENEMLRGEDGKPFEVLLNPLALPSRVNTTTLYELAYGKIAAKQGKPIAVANYTKAGTSRLDEVTKALKEAGLSPTERVYDPAANRWLEKPVTTGVSYTYKLHHMVASKKSARGNAAYDVNEQPLRGSSDAAQAKRLGGLETTALMAKGAYETLRDASTIRGANNAAYWRAIRQGYKPMEPGTPFVVEKFKAMLNGAGMNPRDLGKGVLRLSPFTDKDLDSREPLEIESGKLVRPDNLEPEPGGLFDPKLVALGKWGKITLPCKLPNPAMEGQIALMLGVKISDLRRVLAGEVDLEDVQKKKN